MTQPLTIRAGAYYRTRDGRKVGPMICVAGTLTHPWTDGLRTWTDVGRFNRSDCKSDIDLIAQWADETVVEPLKVGDRVRLLGKTDVLGDVRALDVDGEVIVRGSSGLNGYSPAALERVPE